MKNFALLDENNIVLNISVGDDNWQQEGWIEYQDSNPACIGGHYENGFFYTPKPFESWSAENGQWIPPIPKPDGFDWIWNEELGVWDNA